MLSSASALGVAVALTLLLTAVPAAAAPKRISGKLSRPGYTVIALAAGGKATSVRVSGRRFRLRPPAKRVTLHLRGRNGRYAGPIVIGSERKGKRAILGVRAGARLGGIKVRRGYARVAKRPRKRSLDTSVWAPARKSVPRGVGSFGYVRSRDGAVALKRVGRLSRKLNRARGKLRRARSARGKRALRRQIRSLKRRLRQARPPASDPDLDGIPGPLDIDDDGDLVLDSLDRSPALRAAQSPTEIFGVRTTLGLELEGTVNANARAITIQDDVDPALKSRGKLLLDLVDGDSQELDCGGDNQRPPRLQGLRYCSLGGTGKVFIPAVPPDSLPRFPECCDGDGDGFGTLTGSTPPGGTGKAMFLAHGAGTAEIATGDILVERVTRGGVESQFPATLQFVFVTVPALVGYSDTAGNSAAVSYPVAAPRPGMPFTPGGPGTQGNGFPVQAGPDGDVVLTLTFWRPQRRPIGKEAGDWIDLGGLTHWTGVQSITARPGEPGRPISKPCPQSAYSTADPNLSPAASVAGFTDRATDRPASRANTLTYTLNLSRCFASLGLSWHPGEEANLLFNAVVAPPRLDGATTGAWFRLR